MLEKKRDKAETKQKMKENKSKLELKIIGKKQIE
jgi:hypothetical protein